MDKNHCIGCKKLISSGHEIYVDKPLNKCGFMRFYAHLDCAKSGLAPAEANKVMAQIPAGLKADAEATP